MPISALAGSLCCFLVRPSHWFWLYSINAKSKYVVWFVVKIQTNILPLLSLFSLITKTMDCFWFLVAFLCVNSSFAQQYYDGSDCSSGQNNPGSRYTCNVSSQDQYSCKTFLVYRANQRFDTISKISALFNATPGALLRLNNAESPSEALAPRREVLVPVDCSCTGRFSQANLIYAASETASLSRVACGVFEGLVTALALAEENLLHGNNVAEAGSTLRVPLKCACPDDFASRKGVKYLVTYPFVEGDGTIVVSEKFGISPEELWEANRLESKPTVYPFTTVLVPLRAEPVINLNVPGSPPPMGGFLPTISVEKPAKTSKTRHVFVAGAVIVLSLVLLVLIVLVLYVRALNKRKGKIYQTFSPILSTEKISPPETARSSVCLSPDLLVGIKFSLFNYTVEGIKRATRDFSEENKLACEAYKGVMDNGAGVMIKRVRFGETRRVIDVHSKINHVNIVKLLGVCHGEEDDSSWSYLVFECPGNGCLLRDFLANPTGPLRWPQRAKIAFDIATGLHYLHRCIFPSYAHASVASGNILVTAEFRAKLGGVGAYAAATDGSAGEKADVLALGIVLLELISGREDGEGEALKERVGFLGGGASGGGCFEQLRSFMDPCLKEEYPLAEALCLAVLAKACLEDDPLNRPSTDDIIKVLSRMV